MAVEDFTTYTEVDPDSDITVTSTKVAADTMDEDAVAYVRDDKGASHFGDFEHLITAEYTSYSASALARGLWGLSTSSAANTLGTFDSENNGMLYFVFYTGSVLRARIKDYTNDNLDTWDGGSAATPYYLTIERSGITLTCKIYSDSGRTTLEDTLTITCNSIAQRYIYPMIGRYPGGSTGDVTFYSENLDLQEVVTGIKASPLTLMGVGI